MRRSPGTAHGRLRVEQGVHLLWEEVSLEGAETWCALGQGQPEMRDALMALVEADDIGDSLCLPLIGTQDALECDAPPGASPGANDTYIAQTILSEFCSYPQPLPALTSHRTIPA